MFIAIFNWSCQLFVNTLLSSPKLNTTGSWPSSYSPEAYRKRSQLSGTITKICLCSDENISWRYFAVVRVSCLLGCFNLLTLNIFLQTFHVFFSVRGLLEVLCWSCLCHRKWKKKFKNWILVTHIVALYMSYCNSLTN